MMMNAIKMAGMDNMEKCVACGKVGNSDAMYGLPARINVHDINGLYLDFTASVCEKCVVTMFEYPSRAESEWHETILDSVVNLGHRLARESCIFGNMPIRALLNRDSIYIEISEIKGEAISSWSYHFNDHRGNRHEENW